MFILSTKTFLVPRADGTKYTIPKDFVGEIPEDVGNTWLVQAAIKCGWIATPAGRSDGDLRASDAKAGEISTEYDKRPDTPRKRRKKAE